MGLAAEAGLYVPTSVIPVSSETGMIRCTTIWLRIVQGAIMSAAVRTSSAGVTRDRGSRFHTATINGGRMRIPF